MACCGKCTNTQMVYVFKKDLNQNQFDLVSEVNDYIKEFNKTNYNGRCTDSEANIVIDYLNKLINNKIYEYRNVRFPNDLAISVTTLRNLMVQFDTFYVKDAPQKTVVEVAVEKTEVYTDSKIEISQTIETQETTVDETEKKSVKKSGEKKKK